MNETINHADFTLVKTELGTFITGVTGVNAEMQKPPVQTILGTNDRRIDDLWKTIETLSSRLRYAMSDAPPPTNTDKVCSSGESELHAHLVAQGQQFKDMNSTLNSIINRLTL